MLSRFFVFVFQVNIELFVCAWAEEESRSSTRAARDFVCFDRPEADNILDYLDHKHPTSDRFYVLVCADVPCSDEDECFSFPSGIFSIKCTSRQGSNSLIKVKFLTKIEKYLFGIGIIDFSPNNKQHGNKLKMVNVF